MGINLTPVTPTYCGLRRAVFPKDATLEQREKHQWIQKLARETDCRSWQLIGKHTAPFSVVSWRRVLGLTRPNGGLRFGGYTSG